MFYAQTKQSTRELLGVFLHWDERLVVDRISVKSLQTEREREKSREREIFFLPIICIGIYTNSILSLWNNKVTFILSEFIFHNYLILCSCKAMNLGESRFNRPFCVEREREMEAPGMRLMARFTVRAQPSQCSTTLRTTVRNSTIVVISVTQSTKEMVIKKQKPPSSQKPFIRLQLSLSEPLFSKSLLILWMSWWFLVSQWADTCWEREHQEEVIDTILCVWIKKRFAL